MEYFHKIAVVALFQLLCIHPYVCSICNKLEVDGSDLYEDQIDGEYNLVKHRCDSDGPPLYQKIHDEDSYIHRHVYFYFYKTGSWKGWAIGPSPCTFDSVYAKIKTSDTDPDDADDDWEEWINNDDFKDNPDMEVNCEDEGNIGTGAIIMISLGCTLCVLLLLLAPAIYMYVASKKRSPRGTSSHASVVPVMNSQNQRPAQIPVPPPYSAEAPPVYTIQPYGSYGNENKAMAKDLPSYVDDLTHIIANRKDIALPPPPNYDNPSYTPPPSYEGASAPGEQTVYDNTTEMADVYDNAANEEVYIELDNMNGKSGATPNQYSNRETNVDTS